MALHTKQQFAELCGMTTKKLAIYASKDRRKVIYSGDYVDDSIEPNITFLFKWGNKNKTKLESEVDDHIIISHEQKKDSREYSEPKEIKPNKPNIREPKQPHESRTERLKNELLIEQIELARQKKTKALGENIPLELASQAGAAAFKNAFAQMRNVLEKRLTRWSKHFTIDEIAAERKETLREINEAIKNAIAESKISLTEIVTTNSMRKEIGEHE